VESGIKEDEVGVKVLRTAAATTGGGVEKKINIKRAKLGRLSWRKSRSTSTTGDHPSSAVRYQGSFVSSHHLLVVIIC